MPDAWMHQALRIFLDRIHAGRFSWTGTLNRLSQAQVSDQRAQFWLKDFVEQSANEICQRVRMRMFRHCRSRKFFGSRYLSGAHTTSRVEGDLKI